MAEPLERAARRAIRRGSRSFALASLLFDAETRRRVTLLYAWCRHADDMVDGQEGGRGELALPGSAAGRLATLQAKTAQALAGEPQGEVPFAALARVVAECAIPARLPQALLEGLAMDVAHQPPADMAALLRYCYHVAGCVGEMMALLMGVSPKDETTLLQASALGMAFQIHNIVRDVAEDAARGRCYLPATLLAAQGLTPGNYLDMARRPALFAVLEELVCRARQQEQLAAGGVGALRWRQRWAVLAAMRIYGGIGRRVVGQRRLRRVEVGGGAKLAAVIGALPRALLAGDARRKQ